MLNALYNHRASNTDFIAKVTNPKQNLRMLQAVQNLAVTDLQSKICGQVDFLGHNQSTCQTLS